MPARPFQVPTPAADVLPSDKQATENDFQKQLSAMKLQEYPAI